MKSDFKKSDLKVGMTVECRNSSYSGVYDLRCQTWAVFGEGHYHHINVIDDNLNGLHDFDYDIMKVYDISGKLIWER